MTDRLDFPGRRSAVVLMLVFLVGFATQLYLVRADRRTALEEVVFSSAAGDRAFFPLPEDLDAGDPVLQFEGKSFIANEERPKQKSEFDYLAVGKDESGRFTLYRARAEERDGANPLYVKTGEERFLALRPQP